jgi:KaiC/GvpD/RAD55 family RecA-like ATPase
MTQTTKSTYEFTSSIPMRPVASGTNLLVRGESAAGARDVALELVVEGACRDEGVLLASADVSATALLERCSEVSPSFDRSRLGIVDCSGVEDDEHHRFESYTEPIDDPGDLTAIEVELSGLYDRLHLMGPAGVRIGVFSVSSLLGHADQRRVSRFIHMLTGRVIALDDLGVFLVDEDAVPPGVVTTFEQFCDGVVEVRRDEDGTNELRVSGLEDQPDTWTSLLGFESP